MALADIPPRRSLSSHPSSPMLYDPQLENLITCRDTNSHITFEKEISNREGGWNGNEPTEKLIFENSGFSDQWKSWISFLYHLQSFPVTSTKLQEYLAAIRLRSLTTSICPVVLGFVLAYTREGQWGIFRWLLAFLAVMAVHAARIVVNSYYDPTRRPEKKPSPEEGGRLTPDETALLGSVLYAVGCLGFFLLVWVSPAPVKHSYVQLLALLFFGGLSGSFLYTGGTGIRYIACGELLAFLIFGPITTLFCYAATAGSFTTAPCYYSIPVALTSLAALHCNNCRNVTADRSNGAVTLAVLLGRMRSYILYVVLLYSPFVVIVVLSVVRSKAFLLSLVVAPVTFSLRRRMEAALSLSPQVWAQTLGSLPRMTANVNCLFGFCYILSCFIESFYM